MGYRKGGLRAAFFFFPFTLVVLSYGVPFQYVLGGIRTASFAAAAVWLWRSREGSSHVSLYAIAVAAFAFLSVGHAFSSVYLWVSLQHALNICMAAVLLYWATLRFRESSREEGETFLFPWIAAVAIAEIAIAVFQRLATGTDRPDGTFSNPVFLSEFLAMTAMLLAGRALWDDARTRLPRIAWGIGALLLLAAALSLTSSRGVALAAVPAIGVLLVLRFGVARGLKTLLFLGIPALIVVGWHSALRFDAPDPYQYGRWVFWRTALRIFAENPFGVGLGGYKYFWFQAQEPFPEAFRHYSKFALTPHNEYLEVLVGLGFLGLLFFLLAIVPPMVAAARGWREVPESGRGVAAGAFAALVLTGCQALVNFNFHEAGIFCTDALLLGVLLAHLPGRFLGRAVPIPSWLSKGGAVACTLLAAASLSMLVGTAFFERGMSAVRRGDPISAERSLRTASRFDPLRSPIPDALSGVSYTRYLRSVRSGGKDALKLLDESILWQIRAAGLCPMEQEYPQRLAFLFRERFLLTKDPGNLEAAIRSLDESLRINPFRIEALWEKAMVLQGIGRSDEAADALSRAVSIEPNFCRAYAKLAELWKGKDRRQSSMSEARAVQCWKAARGRRIEEYNRWLVEEPGTAPGTE